MDRMTNDTKLLLENLHRRDHLGEKLINLREKESEDEDWFQLAQNRVQWWALVNGVLNLMVL